MMETVPLFSVLIANKNNGVFLMDAINSVKDQTYPNWEIILVDDASTDVSLELYEQLQQDRRIHVFYNDSNKGCGFTKHRCAKLAQGDICGFLDPDDTLEKDALETMVRQHLNLPTVSLVYSRYYYSDNSLRDLGVSEHQCSLPSGVSFLEYGKGAISHFVTFKKSSYDKTPGIGIHYKRAVDHALYYLLEEVGDVYFIDKPLYHYRSDTGSNISTNTNSDAAFFWHLVVMADACKRRGIELEELVLKEFREYLVNEKQASFLLGGDSVRLSKKYQVGRILLDPFRWLKKQ